jgi:uncharacterized protein DUF4124
MNLRVRHLTLLLALLGTAAYAADVYKSTGPDGTVIYSDRPEGADAQFVYSATPSAPRTQPGGAQSAGRAASGAQAASPPQAPGIPTLPADGPTSAQLKAERQKNCEIAKETQQRYTLSRRLFRTNAVGEREYLDDAAVAEARAKAAADVKDWCD